VFKSNVSPANSTTYSKPHQYFLYIGTAHLKQWPPQLSYHSVTLYSCSNWS